MKQVQINHLNYILEEMRRMTTEKYVKGVEEHQTVLSEDYTALELLDMALEEVTDLGTYLITLRTKLREDNK